MGYFSLTIIFGSLWGYICRRIANKNGRDKNLAFLIGFLFGLFAVIGYAIAGQTKEDRIKEAKEVLNK